MSVIATAVKHLLAAGVTGDALVVAIAEMEAEVRAEPKPRSAGAIRQARYEEKKRQKASEMTQPDENDGSDTSDVSVALPLPPNENNSNPPAPTHPENTIPRARKGARLPVGWMPKPLPDQLADAVGRWPPGAYDRELERMRDWAASATGPNAVKSDWDAAWRNWIRKIDDEGRYRNGHDWNGSGSNPSRNHGKPKDAAIAYLDQKHGFDSGSPPSERRDAGPGGGDRQRAVTGPRSMW